MADTWASIVKKVANSKNSPIRKILVDEVNKLKDCIQYYLDIFYSQHVYVGSGDLQKSLRADDFISVDASGKLSIKVYFDKDQSWGDSWLDGYDGAFKPYIVAYGFKDTSSPNYTFGGFKGYDFIGMGIEKYEAESKYNLKVLLTLPDSTNDIWR